MKLLYNFVNLSVGSNVWIHSLFICHCMTQHKHTHTHTHRLDFKLFILILGEIILKVQAAKATTISSSSSRRHSCNQTNHLKVQKQKPQKRRGSAASLAGAAKKAAKKSVANPAATANTSKSSGCVKSQDLNFPPISPARRCWMTAQMAGNCRKMAGNWRRQARRARFKVRSQKTPKAPFPQSIVLKMEEIARESQETFSKVFANHQVGIYPIFQ